MLKKFYVISGYISFSLLYDKSRQVLISQRVRGDVFFDR